MLKDCKVQYRDRHSVLILAYVTYLVLTICAGSQPLNKNSSDTTEVQLNRFRRHLHLTLKRGRKNHGRHGIEETSSNGASNNNGTMVLGQASGGVNSAGTGNEGYGGVNTGYPAGTFGASGGAGMTTFGSSSGSAMPPGTFGGPSAGSWNGGGAVPPGGAFGGSASASAPSGNQGGYWSSGEDSYGASPYGSAGPGQSWTSASAGNTGAWAYGGTVGGATIPQGGYDYSANGGFNSGQGGGSNNGNEPSYTSGDSGQTGTFGMPSSIGVPGEMNFSQRLTVDQTHPGRDVSINNKTPSYSSSGRQGYVDISRGQESMQGYINGESFGNNEGGTYNITVSGTDGSHRTETGSWSGKKPHINVHVNLDKGNADTSKISVGQSSDRDGSQRTDFDGGRNNKEGENHSFQGGPLSAGGRIPPRAGNGKRRQGVDSDGSRDGRDGRDRIRPDMGKGGTREEQSGSGDFQGSPYSQGTGIEVDGVFRPPRPGGQSLQRPGLSSSTSGAGGSQPCPCRDSDDMVRPGSGDNRPIGGGFNSFQSGTSGSFGQMDTGRPGGSNFGRHLGFSSTSGDTMSNSNFGRPQRPQMGGDALGNPQRPQNSFSTMGSDVNINIQGRPNSVRPPSLPNSHINVNAENVPGPSGSLSGMPRPPSMSGNSPRPMEGQTSGFPRPPGVQGGNSPPSGPYSVPGQRPGVPLPPGNFQRPPNFSGNLPGGHVQGGTNLPRPPHLPGSVSSSGGLLPSGQTTGMSNLPSGNHGFAEASIPRPPNIPGGLASPSGGFPTPNLPRPPGISSGIPSIQPPVMPGGRPGAYSSDGSLGTLPQYPGASGSLPNPTGNIPGISLPNLPRPPGLPNLPSLPSVPLGLPSIPGPPNIAGDISGSLPSLPRPPGLGSIVQGGSNLGSGLPSLPGGLPSLPRPPNIGVSLPSGGISGNLPGVNGNLPGLPNIGGTNQGGTAGALPGISANLPGISGNVPGLPNIGSSGAGGSGGILPGIGGGSSVGGNSDGVGGGMLGQAAGIGGMGGGLGSIGGVNGGADGLGGGVIHGGSNGASGGGGTSGGLGGGLGEGIGCNHEGVGTGIHSHMTQMIHDKAEVAKAVIETVGSVLSSVGSVAGSVAQNSGGGLGGGLLSSVLSG